MLGLGKTELLVIYLLLSRKGWMPTRAIVDLLSTIRKSESAVRATLFRLKKKNIIKSKEEGRETLFALGEAGEKLVEGYMKRLSLTEKKWNGKWLLFSFNIPESQRAVRNVLRDELIALGFGRLHTNLWLSPYDLREECNKLIERLKVKDHTAMFITDYLGDDPQKLAYRVWNLGEIADTWNQLKERCEKEYAEFKKTKFVNSYQEAVEALVRLIRLKESIAEIAAKDPCLPHSLLPLTYTKHTALEKTIFKHLDFFREKSSSIVKFESIEHENHNKIVCKY